MQGLGAELRVRGQSRFGCGLTLPLFHFFYRVVCVALLSRLSLLPLLLPRRSQCQADLQAGEGRGDQGDEGVVQEKEEAEKEVAEESFVVGLEAAGEIGDQRAQEPQETTQPPSLLAPLSSPLTRDGGLGESQGVGDEGVEGVFESGTAEVGSDGGDALEKKEVALEGEEARRREGRWRTRGDGER